MTTTKLSMALASGHIDTKYKHLHVSFIIEHNYWNMMYELISCLIPTTQDMLHK
jgi:hypothetical protein